jgi:hypothetical protein
MAVALRPLLPMCVSCLSVLASAAQSSRPGAPCLASSGRPVGPALNIGWVVTPVRWVDGCRPCAKSSFFSPALNRLALVQLMRPGAMPSISVRPGRSSGPGLLVRYAPSGGSSTEDAVAALAAAFAESA